MESFPPWGAGEIPLSTRPLSLLLWRTTIIPLTDWINFCFTFCTNPLICHRLKSVLLFGFATKLFIVFFISHFPPLFLCKCLILFHEETLWHINEFSHLIWPNNLHDIPSILFVYFLALKLVRFQTSKQPINSLLNRSDLKMTVCEKIERLGSD